MKQLNKMLQEALVRNNVLTAADMEKYASAALSLGQSLKDFLLREGIITARQLLIALSQTTELETVDLSQVVVPPDVIDRIPVKFVWYYQFMPVAIKGSVLTIAREIPLDVKTLDEIRTNVGFDVRLVLTEGAGLQDALKRYYGLASDTIDRMMTKDPERVTSVAHGEKWVEDLDAVSEDPTVSDLVNQIILEAYKKRATDIHVEPYRNRVRFRYRIDGVLVDAQLPDKVKYFIPSILSRIKILANLSITEKRIPQDGSAVVKTKDQQLDLRISTLPTPRGESMVIRILPTKVMLLSLEKLGFDQVGVEKFRGLIRQQHGIIFITGPTGSGKTTTLYACLHELYSTEKKIITIEDPVEYEMDGITQIQINPKMQFGFSDGLRSLLRHDPDIIMVGEVRDVETAEIAIRTALTGHLVFSTLHTNDAASGITRLIDMGIEPYLVASSVEAFVAQRLIRIICPRCKTENTKVQVGIKEEIAQALSLPNADEIKLYHGEGCDYCNRTGFYDRMAVHEILTLNDVIRAAIITKPRSDYIKRVARREGMLTLRQNGWKAVVAGLTTPEEVLNVTAKDDDAELITSVVHPPKSVYAPVMKTQAGRPVRIKKQGKWETKNQYDARIYPRVAQAVEVRYRRMEFDEKDQSILLSDGIEYTTVAADISAGGLRFISKGALPLGSILELQISLDEPVSRISCLAKVCRVEEDNLDNVYTVVNYYLDLSSADRSLISKFVEKHLAEGAPSIEA